jgi:hypothetical protein
VYLLSVLVTLACAFLLLRAYVKVRQRLLLWSGLCFVGLTASNVIVVVDLVLLPDLDLYVWRLGAAAFSMLLLVYGLVWESD